MMDEKIEIPQCFVRLVEAAKGLSHGSDWNNGTHAKLHGYRQKLLDALNECDTLLREAAAPSPTKENPHD